MGLHAVAEPDLDEHLVTVCRKALREKASLWTTPSLVYFFNSDDEMEYYSRVRPRNIDLMPLAWRPPCVVDSHMEYCSRVRSPRGRLMPLAWRPPRVPGSWNSRDCASAPACFT